VYDVRAGEAIMTARGEWIRYSTPRLEGAEYPVGLPAFSPATVHRDADDVGDGSLFHRFGRFSEIII
jgi:hypothetical protein